MAVTTDSLRLLEEQAKTHSTVLVAYSGGKDSLAVLDLCAKKFQRVLCFFMYFVPGLEVCERQLAFARQRYGVEVCQFPHFAAIASLRDGLFCDQPDAVFNLPDIGLKEMYAWVMGATGVDMIVTGAKEADGLKRRQFFANVRDSSDPVWKHVIWPIRKWRKADVLDYLAANKIPLPEAQPGAVTSGIGLQHDTLCWLHDRHPEDFKKILRWFPYAGAAVKRRDYYGIE